MMLHIHGLKEVEDLLITANEKLLAADNNGALTNMNKALTYVKELRIMLEKVGLPDEENK